jgi:hypothetical protein
MRKDNTTPPEDSVNKILRLYSDTGDMQAADRFLQTFLTGSFSPHIQLNSAYPLIQKHQPKSNGIFISGLT